MFKFIQAYFFYVCSHTIQMSDGVVKIEHFEAVHNLDQTHGGLKVAPKLTAAHISPNNLQRMYVRLAVQVYRILSFDFCDDAVY